MKEDVEFFGWILAAILFVVVVFALPRAFLRPSAERAVVSAGNSAVVITNYAWFACGQDDWAGWHFQAVNALGQSVSGTACCGIFKGCTVRY